MEPTPYITPQEHLDEHLERVLLMVQRAMRRWADRYAQASGSYTDLAVSSRELDAMLGGRAPSEEGHGWLDAHGVLRAEEAEAKLSSLQSRIEARLQASCQDEAPSLPLEELRASFSLRPEEIDLLLIAAAPRLSEPLSRLCCVAWVDYSVRQPTVSFVAHVAASDENQINYFLEMLSDNSPLVSKRLLLPGEHDLWKPHTPRLHAPLVVPQRLLDFMRGWALGLARVPGATLSKPEERLSDLSLHADTRASLFKALRRSNKPRVALLGAPSSGRRAVARALAGDLGVNLLEVDLRRALSANTSAGLREELAALLREALLLKAALFLRFDELEGSELEQALRLLAPDLRGLWTEFAGAIFAASPRVSSLMKAMLGPLNDVSLPPLPSAEQTKLWQRALEPHLHDAPQRQRLAQELGAAYSLPAGAIFRATESALAEGGSSRGLGASQLLKAVRQQLDHRLDGLADIISTPMSLEHVVLPEEIQAKIQEILTFARQSEQVFLNWGFRERGSSGQGLSVLFSGPPGTGKTMMAGILARELGRLLYRVDLSRIVDKYIGETEKNLSRIFADAERAQAILLFDEADSLFSKRTEVKSSHDRYANLEVNYLLQKMDDFSGVSLLTTNFSAGIDEAFERRIRFKIAFPMPDPEARAKLWRGLLPPLAPVEAGIDWLKIAKVAEFSGGHIRNAVLRASIQAAEQGGPITQTMLLQAAQTEAREMGRLVQIK